MFSSSKLFQRGAEGDLSLHPIVLERKCAGPLRRGPGFVSSLRLGPSAGLGCGARVRAAPAAALFPGPDARLVERSPCPCPHQGGESAEHRTADFLLAPGCLQDVNTTIMELLIMVYACKTSSAKSIIGVIPYFPYSKQCKMRKRGSIVSKLLASMMCKAGLTHLITMDLHQKEIQGFFNIPVDNLRASPFLLQYIQEEIPDYRNAVIVAKSPASAKRAQSFAERLRLGIAVIHGEAQDAESDLVDGRHSPPMVRSAAAIHPSLEIPMLIPKEKPPITVVGDVGGRTAVIVDDIIDDVDSFLAAAETLKERGAYKIFVMATHGLLSSDAPRLIEESAIDEVVVTNTIPHEIQKLQCPKIKTVDISMILSEAIRRIHNGESMSYLFRNIGLDD
ncbi:phosphoribosyl pyrophosphate synthase-associated protein 2 isoform X1 [Mesoplodon densirostris]|uniref:phosphoribosyl pyrophosphate synthase-associated protein 2 isoform X1 n=1 Tax=Mesoplodon densirostris TaxID=48708 RepID=UPI0028DD2F58|nr:phosphoribosyl pyrophosphate synthase-associated protein 2 isoform X1 [Mesoplodon densirostris]